MGAIIGLLPDTGGDQNNKVEQYFVDALRVPFVSDAMNLVGNLEVAGDEIYIVNHTVARDVVEIGEPPAVQLVQTSYLFQPGKGTYGGILGTKTTEADYFFLKETSTDPFPIADGVDPENVEIKEIFIDDVNTPVDDLINEVVPSFGLETYEVVAGQDWYFRVTQFAKIAPRPSKVYRYVGAAGTYGVNGDPVAPEDFILVSDNSNVEIKREITKLSQLLDDIGATEPIVKDTFFVDRFIGNDLTGQFENANKPFRTLDAIFDLFTRNSTSNETVKIQILSAGDHPIINPIGYYNLEITSTKAAFVDLTNYGDPAGGTQNLYYASNVSGRYTLRLNLPNGGIKNLSNNNGGHISSEDVDAYINCNEILWTAGFRVISVAKIVIEKLNIFDSNGILALPTGSIIELNELTISGSAIFGNNEITVKANTLNIIGSIFNPLGNNNTWELGDINGDIKFSYSHNKNHHIVFNNSNFNGDLNFSQQNGKITLSGTANNLNITGSTDSYAGRVFDLNLINFNCSDLTGYFRLTGNSFPKITAVNCYIRKSDALPLFVADNITDLTAVIQKTILIQSAPGFLLRTNLSSVRTNIEVGGFESNCQSITNDPAVGVDFNVASFKDKLQELVIRSKTDLINRSLDLKTTYTIDGDLILLAGEFIEVPAGGNLTINGYGLEASKIIKNVPGESIFKSPAGGSGGLQMQGLSFTTTGSVFDLVDATGFNAIECNVINFDGCNSLGVINDYRQFLGTTIGIYGCNDGFTLSGSWNGFKITNTNAFGFGAAGTLFKKGVDLTFSSRFFAELNVSLPAGAILSDFDNTNFLSDNLFQLKDGQYTLDGNSDAVVNTPLLLPNITAKDSKTLWEQNVGLEDSYEPFTRLKGEDGKFYELFITAAGVIDKREIL
ncbi:hypothetical protein [Nonlabens agnitus]|uniref:Uncharacterized protein n=1 Tax=Nonlabens agnitus TaxID=870484 RepID=A0A2S9WXC5_9FLAO|nr:hypothetical protein [Nonlabens agnitus]PRP68101.1 hypothetical protein BST86_13900 [Nonlabens agnitus]